MMNEHISKANWKTSKFGKEIANLGMVNISNIRIIKSRIINLVYAQHSLNLPNKPMVIGLRHINIGLLI